MWSVYKSRHNECLKFKGIIARVTKGETLYFLGFSATSLRSSSVIYFYRKKPKSCNIFLKVASKYSPRLVVHHPALPLYSISHISLSPSSLPHLPERPPFIRALLTLDSHSVLKNPNTDVPKQDESMHH